MQITLLRDYGDLLTLSPSSKKSPTENSQQPNLSLRSKVFELSSILDVAKVAFLRQFLFSLRNQAMYAAIIMSLYWFVPRYASSTNRSSQSIQKSICWRRKPTNGNFWLTHSVSIYECALHTWDFHTGNYALHKHVIYHHGLSNYTCCWHRIYSNTIPTICNGIVYPTINKSWKPTINWIYRYLRQSRNVTIKWTNKSLSISTSFIEFKPIMNCKICTESNIIAIYRKILAIESATIPPCVCMRWYFLLTLDTMNSHYLNARTHTYKNPHAYIQATATIYTLYAFSFTRIRLVYCT